MDLQLKGSVAVVTGGTSGIGAAAADLLAAEGAIVHRIDLIDENQIDITDRAALEAFAKGLDRLEVLVNAAGLFTGNKPAAEAPIEDYQRAFQVNVIGTVNTCQVFGPLLRAADEGSIVNLASQSSMVALPEQSAYVTSKGGVAAFTRALAIDWARYPVRVNAVAPSFTRTPMNGDFLADAEKVAGVEGRIPLGRFLEPEEMATAIAFLASPVSSGITGTLLPVDGGWTAGESKLPWE